MFISVGASKFLRVRSFLPDFPHTCPKSPFATFAYKFSPTKIMNAFFWCDLQQKCLHLYFANVGRHFFSDIKGFYLDISGFLPDSQGFCPNFQGFYPDFRKIQPAPRVLHHCMCATTVHAEILRNCHFLKPYICYWWLFLVTVSRFSYLLICSDKLADLFGNTVGYIHIPYSEIFFTKQHVVSAEFTTKCTCQLDFNAPITSLTW